MIPYSLNTFFQSWEAEQKPPGESDFSIDPERVLSIATEIDRAKVIKIRQPEQSNYRESLQKLRKFIKNIKDLISSTKN